MKHTKRKCLVACMLVTAILIGLLPANAQQVKAASEYMNIYGIYLDGGEKGDAVLVESNGEYLLMDMGMYSNMPAICHQLKALGVTCFDLYFSHLHMDHVGAARGDWIKGLNYIKEQGLEIKHMYLPDPSLAPESGDYPRKYSMLQNFMETQMGGTDRIIYLKRGDSFKVGGAVAAVIGPDNAFVNSIHPSDYRNKVGDAEAETEAGQNVMETYYENNCSLITRISCAGVSYLTAGDMLKDEADYMLQYYSYQLKSDIYKMSHHGTATGNSTAMLAAIDPIYSFASNSANTGISESTNMWVYGKSCNAAKQVSMPYFIASEQETIIYHAENGKITPYRGTLIDEENKMTGWVALYGADGINRKKDYYYLDENGVPLTGVQTINGSVYYLGNGGCMEYGDYDENGIYQGWKRYSGGIYRFYFEKEGSNLTTMATGVTRIGSDYYLFYPDGTKEEGIGVFALKVIDGATYAINEDSTIVVGKDIEYDGYEYHFYNDGKMAEKQFVEKDGNTYYYGKYGRKIYSTLLTYAGKYYYLGSDGVMYRNKYLTLDNGDTYYFGEDGVAITNQFKKRSGAYYYFGKYGTLVKDQIVTVDGDDYLLCADGARAGRGFHVKDNKEYFTDKNGKILKKCFVKSGGNIYYVGKYGTKVTDQVVTVDQRDYYVDAEGIRAGRGFHEIGRKTYFTDSKGRIVKNQLVRVDGESYYLGKYGTVVKSKKIRTNGVARYFGEDGKMYRDTIETIGQKTYVFDEKGVMRVATEEEITAMNARKMEETTDMQDVVDIEGMI